MTAEQPERATTRVVRHPHNPYWCQQHDNPHPIYRADWDQALADGHVTIEHLQARIEGMLHHARQTEGPIGFDADWFIIALTAAGIRMNDSIRFDIRTHDHDPPHAHIVVKGEPKLALTINLQTATIVEELPGGMSKTGRHIERFVRDHQNQFLELWSSYQSSEPGA